MGNRQPVIPSERSATALSDVEGGALRKTPTRKLLAALCLLMLPAFVSGCAGTVENWIVNTRIHQGDIALQNRNSADALLAYSLALKVDPSNPQARAGFVTASGDEAQLDYTRAKFDDALAAIAAAMKVDPTSVRLQALKTTIDNAKLKEEIVQSNYPAYEHAGLLIRQSYARLDEANALLLHSLRRFQYTYDVADLTAAIQQSYELQLEVARDTNRLMAYRQLVQSGAPASATQPSASGSLLPLP
jgi:tetratricopeptide (TPR) repeat protein